MSYTESSGIDEESSTSCHSVGSFLEPRDPSITNPWMRPRPNHGINLCSQFERESMMEKEQTITTPQHVKVYLRLKPTREETGPAQYKNEDDTCLMVVGPQKSRILYHFTHIFNKSNQVTVFNKMVKDNLRNFIEGHDFTLLTYGASGSGKTFSLMGEERRPGVVPRCLEFLFSQVCPPPQPRIKPQDGDTLVLLNHTQASIETQMTVNMLQRCDKREFSEGLALYRRMSTTLSRASRDWQRALHLRAAHRTYEVWVSFAEIYMEQIHDLLQESSNGLQNLRLVQPPDRQPYIKGLRWLNVRNGEEAYCALELGRSRLSYARTNVNATSSRSHCIFSIKLVNYQIQGETPVAVVSTFRLCDLAGLERAKMTGNQGVRLNESKRINCSLLTLERCLSATRQRQAGQRAQPPYRESKLTALLQRALCGRERVAMLVTINPEKKFFEETQHVLRFSALAQDVVLENGGEGAKQIQLRMSRPYSEIGSSNERERGRERGQELEKRKQELDQRESDLEQREADLEQHEADLEQREAEFQQEKEEEWPQREREVRAEVAAKFRKVQEKIYADNAHHLEQEKRILAEEYDQQIEQWRKHYKRLEQETDALRDELRKLKEHSQKLNILCEESTYGKDSFVSEDGDQEEISVIQYRKNEKGIEETLNTVSPISNSVSPGSINVTGIKEMNSDNFTFEMEIGCENVSNNEVEIGCENVSNMKQDGSEQNKTNANRTFVSFEEKDPSKCISLHKLCLHEEQEEKYRDISSKNNHHISLENECDISLDRTTMISSKRECDVRLVKEQDKSLKKEQDNCLPKEQDNCLPKEQDINVKQRMSLEKEGNASLEKELSIILEIEQDICLHLEEQDTSSEKEQSVNTEEKITNNVNVCIQEQHEHVEKVIDIKDDSVLKENGINKDDNCMKVENKQRDTRQRRILGEMSPVLGLPLPDNFCTAKKEIYPKNKENCAGMLSSRRKLFTRRKMDEAAAEAPVDAVVRSARCLLFSPIPTPAPSALAAPTSPQGPPAVPRPYNYQRPTRSRRNK